MNRALAWALALAPQLLVVAGLAVREEIGRATGAEVVLEVRAVDPMDMLSGRYVSVPLAISVLDLDAVAHFARELEHGDAVFVRLRKGEKHWEAAGIVEARPDPEQGPFLKASVRHGWSPDPGRRLRLEYELDRFYIPQEAADPSVWDSGGNRRHELAVVARIDARGRPHVVDLLVDGQPYAEWNREQPARGR